MPVTVSEPTVAELTVAVSTIGLPDGAAAAETSRMLVLAWLAVWVSTDVLALKLPSPPKEAVRVWLPAARLEVVKLAVVVPALVVNFPWPMLVPPSEKITTPVGLATAVLPEPLLTAVAAKVTSCPDTNGEMVDNTVLV